VEEKLGYFVGNNASNNDTLVMTLAEEQVFGDRCYDAGEWHLCHAGHVVNLLVKAFWFGDVGRTLLQDSIVVTSDTMASRRTMGPR
jgi:hypothetical protein